MEMAVGNRRVVLLGDAGAENVLVEPIDHRGLSSLATQAELIRELSGPVPFLLAAVPIREWNRELSPWEAPAVFGSEPFGAGAGETLAFISGGVIPSLGGERRFYLGGYSLAGLFSLWAGYESDLFCGVAAASPSVWFPGWEEFTGSRRMRSPAVYLSLGDREERTRNPALSKVGDAIRRQYRILEGTTRTLQWNPGNHFMDVEKRVALGFSYLLTLNRPNKKP